MIVDPEAWLDTKTAVALLLRIQCNAHWISGVGDAQVRALWQRTLFCSCMKISGSIFVLALLIYIHVYIY